MLEEGSEARVPFGGQRKQPSRSAKCRCPHMDTNGGGVKNGKVRAEDAPAFNLACCLTFY
jgi:hypothetical protein